MYVCIFIKLHITAQSGLVIRVIRRRTGNGGDMGGKQKKRRKERVGSVAANSDNLGSNEEAGGGAQGA